MNENTKNFAKNYNTYKAAAHLSSNKICAALGCNRAHEFDFTSGYKLPTINELETLARLFNTTVKDLLRGVDMGTTKQTGRHANEVESIKARDMLTKHISENKILDTTEVANACGLSRTTIDRCLSGKPLLRKSCYIIESYCENYAKSNASEQESEVVETEKPSTELLLSKLLPVLDMPSEKQQQVFDYIEFVKSR